MRRTFNEAFAFLTPDIGSHSPNSQARELQSLHKPPHLSGNATNSLLKKDLERAAVSTVRNYCSPKANRKRGSSSLRCSEWRAKTVFQQTANYARCAGNSAPPNLTLSMCGYASSRRTYPSGVFFVPRDA